MRPTLGCCSWSLRPESPIELADRLKKIGFDHVQLALDPLRTGAFDRDTTLNALARAGAKLASGMMAMAGEDYSTLDSIRRTGGVRLDETWDQNLSATYQNARLAKELGIDLVTFHAGFLPHDADDPERAKLLDRLRTMIDVFAEQGVHVGLETGQETAGTLLSVLRELDRPTVGVNFDPANMILYDMGEPVSALERLAPYVRQLHFKDAVRTKVRGEWGTEVPVGTGEVDWRRLLRVVQERAIPTRFMFEREAGENRVGDLAQGLGFVKGLLDGAI